MFGRGRRFPWGWRPPPGAPWEGAGAPAEETDAPEAPDARHEAATVPGADASEAQGANAAEPDDSSKRPRAPWEAAGSSGRPSHADGAATGTRCPLCAQKPALEAAFDGLRVPHVVELVLQYSVPDGPSPYDRLLQIAGNQEESPPPLLLVAGRPGCFAMDLTDLTTDPGQTLVFVMDFNAAERWTCSGSAGADACRHRPPAEAYLDVRGRLVRINDLRPFGIGAEIGPLLLAAPGGVGLDDLDELVARVRVNLGMRALPASHGPVLAMEVIPGTCHLLLLSDGGRRLLCLPQCGTCVDAPVLWDHALPAPSENLTVDAGRRCAVLQYDARTGRAGASPSRRDVYAVALPAHLLPPPPCAPDCHCEARAPAPAATGPPAAPAASAVPATASFSAH